jgi:hypothetical protein
MTALIIIAVVLAVIVAAVLTLAIVGRRQDTPAEQYRRNLRGILRIRGRIRGGDPHATQIGPNRDAVIGYGSGGLGR